MPWSSSTCIDIATDVGKSQTGLGIHAQGGAAQVQFGAGFLVGPDAVGSGERTVDDGLTQSLTPPGRLETCTGDVLDAARRVPADSASAGSAHEEANSASSNGFRNRRRLVVISRPSCRLERKPTHKTLPARPKCSLL